MDKKKIAGGLNGLIQSATAPTQEQQPAKVEAPKEQAPKAPTKTACYSLPVDVIEGMKYIAYFDRRKLNAVVAEAFAQYIDRWNNTEHKAEKAKRI